MSEGINNGKHCTNNIYIVKMFFIIIAFIASTGIVSALKDDKGWVIVIDPGHGGKDPGASGSFSREKNITLAIAFKTGEYIQKNLNNVTVIYTRKDDSTVDLVERSNIANKKNADLFISIHANWAKSKSVHGAETFVMGHSKDKENLDVAMKENEVILLEDDYTTKYEEFDPKSPESYIIFSLKQNVYLKQSTDLATEIQAQLSERTDRKDRGVKQAGFWVLFTTTMPSVLIETGFITNLSEEKFLNTKQGQDYLASAIFRACRDYIDKIEKKSYISIAKNQNTQPKDDNSAIVISKKGEITFMVQIVTSSERNEIKPENFKGLKEVVEIDTQDRFKYATGTFDDYSAAVKYRKKIEVVFPDAFVIAVKDNKILPLQQALEQKKSNK
jgi:N-acetylmuramoyl-L-alanine amidase